MPKSACASTQSDQALAVHITKTGLYNFDLKGSSQSKVGGITEIIFSSEVSQK